MTPSPFPVGPGRRLLDVLVAGPLLVLTAPLVAVAALLVLLTDGRPVLFWQARVGEGGRPFRICKLRTMRAGSGPGVTANGDARVTRVGRVLRRTSVDELPQLWQVLRGTMTLVGPRPESVELAARYPEGCRLPLLARPGLTGPAQLRFRERTLVPPPGWEVDAWYLSVLVPRRTAADLEYLARPTLLRTVWLLALTAGFVVGVVHLEETVGLAELVGPTELVGPDKVAGPETPVVEETLSPRTAT